jgi:hypothetical protein
MIAGIQAEGRGGFVTGPWERVQIGIVQLWRIKKPSFDRAMFARRLDSFPGKSIGGQARHSTAEIMDFAGGNDGVFAELYLWR